MLAGKGREVSKARRLWHCVVRARAGDITGALWLYYLRRQRPETRFVSALPQPRTHDRGCRGCLAMLEVLAAPPSSPTNSCRSSRLAIQRRTALSVLSSNLPSRVHERGGRGGGGSRGGRCRWRCGRHLEGRHRPNCPIVSIGFNLISSKCFSASSDATNEPSGVFWDLLQREQWRGRCHPPLPQLRGSFSRVSQTSLNARFSIYLSDIYI